VFGFNELSTPVKAIISLAFVLLLVVVAGLILRRITGGRLKFPGQGARARQPRLGIVDVFEMDRQRQLVLLRRDNVEHLVMIGGPNDLVIEASIVRSARAQVPIAAEPVDMPLQPEPRQPAVAAPEPAAAPPPRAAPAALPARPQPSEQATVPAAAAMAAAAAAVAGQALASTATPRPASAPTAPTGTLPATSPARTAATDDFVASLEAEMARDMAARTAPIQAVTSPGTPAVTPAATPPLATPPLATPPLATPARPILEPIATPASARASQVELDEMTRQLQEALARPFSGVKPGAASPEAPATAEEDSKAKDATPPKKQAESETAVAAPPPVGVAKPEPLAADLDREMQAAMLASLLPDEKIEQRTAETVVKPRDAIAALKAADAAAPIPAAPAKPLEPAQESMQESMQQSTQEAAKQDAAPAPVAAKPEPAKPAKPAPAAPETQPARAGAPQRQDTESREQKPEGESVADEKPAEPKEATAPASSGTGPDPFSVDAIEAEFARLLNRSATPKT
jgi:flagellar protein FliO/FliZ